MKRLLSLLLAIFDLFPGRKERLLNAIDAKKAEIRKFQNKEGSWTLHNSVHYNKLLDQLYELEKRARNAGL